MMLNKKLLLILIVFQFLPLKLVAEPAVATDSVAVNSGIKSVSFVSENTNTTSLQPFASVKYKNDLFSPLFGYQFYQNYQLIDSDEKYYSTILHKTNIALDYNPFELLNVDLEFSYFTGGYNYKKYAAQITFEFDFSDYAIAVDLSYDDAGYDINSLYYNSRSLDTAIEFSYYFDKLSSTDFSYSYYTAMATFLESVFIKHTARIGISSAINDSWYFLAGVNSSYDSSDYIGCGADIAVVKKILSDLSLSLYYNVMYFIPQSSDKKMQDAAGIIVASDEPYLLQVLGFKASYTLSF